MDEGELRLIRELVNTYDVEEGADALAAPEDLTRWLHDRGLLDPAEPVGPGDLAHAVALREAVRELLAVNHDGAGPDAAGAAAVLTTAASRAGLRADFTATGTHRLVPTATGADRALGRLLVVVTEAMAGGSWQRLKVCRNDACRWAFFDASRSGAGKWCSMAVCGNRRKAQAWRARQRSATPTRHS